MGLIKTVLVASAAIISVPASAAEYIFDININGTSGSGTFVTQGDASSGLTLIQSLTGTFGGSSMALLSPGTFPLPISQANDNLFTTTSPFFTFNGLSFSASGTSFNIWSNNGSLSACSTNQSCFQRASFSARQATAAVPEPGVWAMLLLGFFSIGGAMRSTRRRQKIAVSYA